MPPREFLQISLGITKIALIERPLKTMKKIGTENTLTVMVQRGWWDESCRYSEIKEERKGTRAEPKGEGEKGREERDRGREGGRVDEKAREGRQ